MEEWSDAASCDMGGCMEIVWAMPDDGGACGAWGVCNEGCRVKVLVDLRGLCGNRGYPAKSRSGRGSCAQVLEDYI